MFLTTWISIAVCLATLLLTLLIQHRTRLTLGLPLAYMVNLMLIHVPGAFVFAYSGGLYSGMQSYSDAISSGIMLTAVGALCFVIGMAFGTRNGPDEYAAGAAGLQSGEIVTRLNPAFSTYCLIAGWVLAFGVGPLRAIPTLGTAIYFGSSIWMLATLIGLAKAFQARNLTGVVIWFSILMVYPLTVLLGSGFMSYGSAAVIVVGSLAMIRVKRPIYSLMLIVVLGYLGMSIFVNYFSSRAMLRNTIWGGAPFEERVDAVASAFSDFQLLNLNNPQHMRALTLRLNQNEFVGIAANRLNRGQAEFLRGETFRDALLSPIPRAIWKNKPIEGGSGVIVRDMTGLMRLRTNTSWGIGNVMEFYINFGMWSLVTGFLLLGFLIAWVDRRAAAALCTDDYSKSLYFFLPGVALIQPNGSLVDVVGGAFAALLAALGLRMGWKFLNQSGYRQTVPVAGEMPRGPR